MKKIMIGFFILVLSRFASAAIIETVAFHPVPSGRYDRITVSRNLRADNELRIFKLVAPGNLNLTSPAGGGGVTGGNIVVVGPKVNNNDTNGYLSIGTGKTLDVTSAVFNKPKSTPGTSVTAEFYVKGVSGGVEAKKVVAFKSLQNVYFGDAGSANGRQLSAPATLRWVKIKALENGAPKEYFVLGASGSDNVCGVYSTAGGPKDCCINPSSAACQNYIKNNNFYTAAVAVAGVEFQLPQ